MLRIDRSVTRILFVLRGELPKLKPINSLSPTLSLLSNLRISRRFDSSPLRTHGDTHRRSFLVDVAVGSFFPSSDRHAADCLALDGGRSLAALVFL